MWRKLQYQLGGTERKAWREVPGSSPTRMEESTTIDGINLIIGGAKVSEYPTEKDFISNIVKKGISDGILESNPYTRTLLD